MPNHVVSLSLFDSIDEYTKLLASGAAISRGVVPQTSPVLSFTENAFVQFFENGVGVELVGFDIRAKRQAARLRRSERERLSKPSLALISLFMQFCDIHDDVLGAGYGGQGSVLEKFHTKIVVRLIDRISALAKVDGDEPLCDRASSALRLFSLAVAAYDWTRI